MDRVDIALEMEQCAKRAALARTANSAHFFISCATSTLSTLYRVVQLKFTQEIEVSYMMFERYLSIFSMASLKKLLFPE